MEPASTPTNAATPFRSAWWITSAAAIGLLVLRCIQWSRGRHSLPDLLVPCGLLALAAGNLVRPLGMRRVLMSSGIVLVIVALILRYQS